MTFPTGLSPWYVVFRIHFAGADTSIEYWTTDHEEQKPWTTNPNQAMLFMNLSSAARVADSDAGLVQVIYNKDGLREFRPREFSN